MSDRAAATPSPMRWTALFRSWRRWLAGAAILSALWLSGLVWFTATIPSGVDDPDSTTDAIVVLTGGSQRLAAGLDLLAAGKAKKLFVTGVHQGVAVADLLRVSHTVPASVVAAIELGHAADSTLGNAAETAAWMRKEGFSSLRLVTASYHMRRSLFEFARTMPETRLVPHPVFPERIHLAQWWESPGTAVLVVGEYHKYVGAVLRALVVGAPSASPSLARGSASPAAGPAPGHAA